MPEEQSELLVRIEYEFPLLRAIYSVWFDDVPETSDDQYLQYMREQHPGFRLRKFQRGIPNPDVPT